MRSGAIASRVVGIASNDEADENTEPPVDLRLKKPTARPATAMPMVLALTAKPIAAGVTS